MHAELFGQLMNSNRMQASSVISEDSNRAREFPSMFVLRFDENGRAVFVMENERN